MPLKKSETLMTVISLDNCLQQGDAWNEFLTTAEKRFEKNELNKLIIVTTGYLQRHYFTLGLDKPLNEKTCQEKAYDLDRQWLEKQGVYFKNLKIPVEIIDWQGLLAKPAHLSYPSFNVFFDQIKQDFHHDREFKHLVEDHADRYITRKIKQYLKEQKKEVDRNVFFKVAIDYALEECAALVQLFHCSADRLAYPHGKPPPINYVWKKYFDKAPLHYENYKVDKKTIMAKTNPIPFFKTESSETFILLTYLQEILKNSQWNTKQQYQFIFKLNALISEINSYAPNETVQEKTKIIHRRSI